MSVRWYKTGGKRYYVIDVEGYKIGAETGRGPGRTGTSAPRTYAVLDRDNCHREVAIFEPRQGVGVALCRERAVACANQLNAEDEDE